MIMQLDISTRIPNLLETNEKEVNSTVFNLRRGLNRKKKEITRTEKGRGAGNQWENEELRK